MSCSITSVGTAVPFKSQKDDNKNLVTIRSVLTVSQVVLKNNIVSILLTHTDHTDVHTYTRTHVFFAKSFGPININPLRIPFFLSTSSFKTTTNCRQNTHV